MNGAAHRSGTWAWARALGGAAILAVIALQLGMGPFLDGLRRLSVWSLLAATSLTALTTVCSAWRWQSVARGLGIRLRLGTAVAGCYRSQFLNGVLPGGVVGDVHRGVRHGLDAGDLGRGLRAVGWERTAGQVVFVVLAVTVLLVLDSPVRPAVRWVAAGTVVGAVTVVLLLRTLPQHRPSRWSRVLRVARADIKDGLLDRRAWPVVTVTSLVVAVGHSGVFLVAAWTTGSDASLLRLWPLAMVVMLAMLVPFTVGGWGPREGAAAWAFAAAGLGATQGVAAATAYGVMGFVATLPGGIVLAGDRIRRSAARRRSDAGPASRPTPDPEPPGRAAAARS